MRVLAEGLTDIGRCRQSNEDSLAVENEKNIYVVADGVGGQPAGEIASRLVADKFPDLLSGGSARSGSDTAGQLGAAVQGVNRQLIAAAADKPEWRGMSTTLVAAWHRPGVVHIANVGDSRAYLIRGQQIEQVSEDHTVLAEQQRQGLPPDDSSARMAHVLTRCLGLDAEVEPSLAAVELLDGDRILLCSDGLTDSLSDEVIRSVVLSTRTPGEGCRMLVELANRNGGRDNITVLLLYFDEATLKTKFSNLFARRS